MVSNKHLDTSSRNGYTVMDMGDMEIWDGADLSLIREMFTRLVDGAKHENVGIDMKAVKYIPSGFFGLLYDWHERGIGIRLYDAKSHVKKMLWFRQFFAEISDGCYELTTHEAHLESVSGYSEINSDHSRISLPVAETSESEERLSLGGIAG